MSERANKITWIKQREKAGLSFIEIVNAYNTTFGTNHFAELFGNPALPGESKAKRMAQDLHDFWIGDSGFP